MARALHPLAATLDEALRALTAKHDAEVKALSELLRSQNAVTVALARSAKSAAEKLRRQRDAHQGKAAEYRSYAIKYQRELLAARAEIKQLLKENNA